MSPRGNAIDTIAGWMAVHDVSGTDKAFYTTGRLTSEMVMKAAQMGVPAIVSSLYETSVGLAAGLALAACLPDLPYACGLGTASLLAADVVVDPLVPVEGMLDVRRPVPDPDLLAAYGAPLEEEEPGT